MQSSYYHCDFVCFVYKLRVVAFEVIVQQLHSPLLYTLYLVHQFIDMFKNASLIKLSIKNFFCPKFK